MEEETRTNKERKRKKHRKKHYLLRLILLILIVVGAYFLLTSSLFTIYSISVEGNERYSDAEIINMTETRTGDNLFKTSGRKIKKSLASNPYFQSVSVKKKLPDTLVISVSEKQALMAIKTEAGYAIIDLDASVLEIADSSEGCTLVTGVTLDSAEPGDTASSSDKTLFSDVRRLVSAVDKSGLFFPTIDISISEDRLYIYDDLYFEGQTEDLINNTEGMKSVLFKLNEQSITRGVLKMGDDGYVSYYPVTE